jgi:acyl carrier protein
MHTITMHTTIMHTASPQADGHPGTTDVAARVSRLVALQCGRPEVDVDQRLTQDLGFDSLDRACLSVAVEDIFDLPLPPLYADSFERVSDLVAFIERGGQRPADCITS